MQSRDTAPRLLQGRRPPVCVLDSDADSEDELRMLVTQELARDHKTAATEDEGNLEVVGDDFVVKSSMFWGGEKTDVCAQFGGLKSQENDEEYDSADTDEILTQNKNSGKAEDPIKTETCSKKSPKKSKMINGKKPAIKISQAPTESNSENDEGSSSDSIDSDYEAMMGNCHRLELSLGDLENLVKNMENEQSDDSDTKAGPSKTSKPSSVHETGPQRERLKKSGINPEDILASLFGPDVDKKEKMKKVKKSNLPAFVGTKDLFGSSALSTGLKRAAEKVNCEFGEEPKRLRTSLKELDDDKESSKAQVPMLNEKDNTAHTDCSSNAMEIIQESKKLVTQQNSSLKVNVRRNSEPKHPTTLPQITHSPRNSSSSDEEEEEQSLSLKTETSKAQESSASDSSDSFEESETSSDEEEEKSNKSEADPKPSSKEINENTGLLQQSVLDPVKQQQDNQKRLAALEQRQKESEQQKKLIQGALSKVVSN